MAYLDLIVLGWDAGGVSVDGVVDCRTACGVDVFANR